MPDNNNINTDEARAELKDEQEREFIEMSMLTAMICAAKFGNDKDLFSDENNDYINEILKKYSRVRIIY